MTSLEPLRILATSDLHYGLYPAGDSCTVALAKRVCESDADVFIIGGDVAGADPAGYETCLRLFEGFAGPKLLVPGNHDLWTQSGSSLVKYREFLPQAAAKCGFRMLDVAPAVIGDTAFVGNIGWYDYSFRSSKLELTTDDYRRKSIPGLCNWNDGVFVRWEFEDDEFTELCAQTFEQQYASVEAKVAIVVAVLHHLPFAELLYGPTIRPLEFCKAYMGAARFGELLLRCPKVRYVLCGHRHGKDTCEKGGLRAFVIGSEYKMKRLLSLDVRTGEYGYSEFTNSESSARS